MRIPTAAERAEYDQISKQDAIAWNAARATASQEYDRKLKPYNVALKAAWGTPEYEAAEKAYIQAMIKFDGQRDAKNNKASRASNLVMVAAWNRYILGLPEEQPVQP